MAVDALTNEWIGYRDAALRFYGVADAAVSDQQSLEGPALDAADDALERCAGHSQNITEIALGMLPAPGEEDRGSVSDLDADRVVTLLLAVAAVDAAVGCSALAVAPERPLDDFGLADVEDAPSESPFAVIAQADLLFGSPSGLVGGAGSDPTREQLLEHCHVSADRLVDQASTPTLRFGGGLVTAGIPLVLPPGGDAVTELERVRAAAGRIRQQAIGLLASCFHKLIGLAGESAQQLARRGISFLELQAIRAAKKQLRQAFTSVLGRLAGRHAALQRIDMRVNGAVEVPAQASAAVSYEVASLISRHAQIMDRTTTAAKWVRRASPLIGALATPLVVVGLDALGIGFVLYMLDTRLGGHNLPSRVAGMVAIVERHV
jgi:hypothetical protein